MKVKIFTVLLICVPLFLWAQWSDDPSVNTKIADTTGYQVQPKVVVDESGNSFVSWFSAGDDMNFNVYMQRLDVNGNKLWADDGLLISNHQTATWTTDYGLALDKDDNAILVNQDMRTNMRCVYAWKISQDGDFLWGNDGIALSDNSTEDLTPKVNIDQENNAIVMWEALPLDTNDFIKTVLRKVSPDGTILWDNVAIEKDSANCWMPRMINTEDTCSIVVWIETDRDTSHAPGSWEFMYPYAQKIDAEGNFVWPEPVQLDDAMNMPLFPFAPSLKPDGNGGLFVSWIAFPQESLFYSCFVQHVNANGEVQWDQNGVNVTDSIQFLHTNPHIVTFPENEGIAVFWNEERQYSSTDIENSIFGQKISMEGDKLWTAQGKVFDGPYNDFDTNTSICDARLDGQGEIALFYYHKFLKIEGMDTIFAGDIYANKVDTDGNPVWAERTIISNAESELFDYDISHFKQDQWIMVWGDNRNDPEHDFQTGIYAQNISVDGSIGPTSVEESYIPQQGNLSLYPNPCEQNTTVSFELQSDMWVEINIMNIKGQLRKRKFTGELQKGDHQFVVDTKGLEPGIYIVSIITAEYVNSQKLVKY